MNASQDSRDSSTSGRRNKPKRSAVACRRCRRLRTKCVNEDNKPPCAPCRKAGSAVSRACSFADRGDNAERQFRIKPAPSEQPSIDSGRDNDHGARSANEHDEIQVATPDLRSEFRREPEGLGHENQDEPEHEEAREEQHTLRPSMARKVELYSASDVWSLLPPHEELIEGCRVFLTTCLQVGFVPKSLFLEQLENDRDSVPVFLLLAMLGISARFTPALCTRFGCSRSASAFFVDIAQVMVAEEMWKISLENTQAFFLLGMADWGSGEKSRSAICMGIAVRMAGVQRLHREETYVLDPEASADEVVQAESARRTFWVIQNHDNLYTQKHLPVSFSKSDITTLLPSEEHDFAFGRIPPVRAALAGTRPAQDQPSLTSLPSRSLFATLIQVHDLWGSIARDDDGEGAGASVEAQPWLPGSRYWRIASALRDWEASMPSQHRWSAWNLRGYKAEHVHLAYLSIVTIARLNNIILRRAYISRIFRHMIIETDPVPVDLSSTESAPSGFWEDMARQLFSDVWALFEAVDVWFSPRSTEDGYPAMLGFSIFISGSLAAYLHRWPRLCPELASSSQGIVRKSLEMLTIFKDKWPTASVWIDTLRKIANKPREDHGSQVSSDGPLRDIMTGQEASLSTETSVARSPYVITRLPNFQMGQSQVLVSTRAAPISPHTHSVVRQSRSGDQHPHPPGHKYGQNRNSHTLVLAPQGEDSELFGQHDNLRLLSDAAAFDAYVVTGNDHQTIGATPAEPTRYQYSSSTNGGDTHGHRPGDMAPSAAGVAGFSPTSTIESLLREPLEGSFADVLQGYVQLGWPSWEE